MSAVNFPYVWIKCLDYVYLDDPKFGCSFNGTTDDAPGLQSAINATAFGLNGSKKRKLFLPNADITLKTTVTVPACLGFGMEGEGKWATRFIMDPLAPSGDALIINSSQHTDLAGFAMVGKQANPAGRALSYGYSPVVYASYAHALRDVWITSDDLREAFTTGIWFSPAYGNNSEVKYDNVYIFRWKEAAVHLAGSQQKSHSFTDCSFVGYWDGVTPGLNGGKYGVLCQDGQYHWRGGGISSCSLSAFNQGGNNDPKTIENCMSELCYRFFDGGEVANNGRQNVRISNCTIKTFNHDPNGVIKYAGLGTLRFEDNYLWANNGTGPKIRISPSDKPIGIHITGNNFATPGSDSVDPLIVANGQIAGVRDAIIINRNIYTSSAGQYSFRNEVLKQVAATSYDLRLSSHDVWRLNASSFAANAASQTLEWMVNLPKGITYEEFFIHTANYFAHNGGAAVTLRVGTTSGGDELLKDSPVSTTSDTAWYGKGDAYVGSKRDVPGGHMPDYQATSKVYVTVSVSSGTVGDGTVSNLTRGFIMAPVRYVVAGRYLT